MTEQKQSRGRGCLLYGLITVALVFLGVVVGIYFGTRKAVRYAIETYTTNAPVTIPTVQVDPAQQRAIVSSLLQQFQAATNKDGPEEWVLGETELNVLIAQTADLKPFHNHIYLQPQESDLKALLSLPLDQFKPWQEFAEKMGGTSYVGRYLNAMAYVNLAVTNGLFKVVPRKIVVSATTLPDKFLTQFPWDTVTKSLNDNADFRAALQRVDTIFVKDNKVHVKFRR